MSGTLTPGIGFFIRFDGTRHSVVPVSELQAERMRERGVKHVYASSSQAYAVRKRLEEKRDETPNLV